MGERPSFTPKDLRELVTATAALPLLRGEAPSSLLRGFDKEYLNFLDAEVSRRLLLSPLLELQQQPQQELNFPLFFGSEFLGPIQMKTSSLTLFSSNDRRSRNDSTS